MGGGEVAGLAAIGGEVVEFPRLLVVGDELPVADPHGPVADVAPPQILVDRGLRIAERAQEAPPVQRRHRPAVVLVGGRDGGEFEHRGRHVHQMHRGAPQFARGRDAPRPVDDPGRGDAPLMHPGLVPPKRRVGGTRPAGTQGEERLSGARRRRRIVPFAADQHLGRGAVVAGEEDERVCQQTGRLQRGDDPPHLAVHGLDHRGVDRHLFRLERLLCGREFGPRQRAVQFVGPERAEHVLDRGRWPQAPLHRAGGRRHDPACGDPVDAGGADGIPAGPVAVAILRDQLGRSVQRKVRRREGDVVEKRPARMLRGMLPQALDGVVADQTRHVCGGRLGHGPAVGGHRDAGEVVALSRGIHEQRPREPLRPRVAVDVPLARVVRAVAGRREQFRQEPRPRWPPGLSAPLDPAVGQAVAVHRLRVVAGEQRRAGGPAAGGVVALREPQAARREGVEVRRVDLAAVDAEVGETEVVGQDHEDVGPRWLRPAAGGGNQGGR